MIFLLLGVVYYNMSVNLTLFRDIEIDSVESIHIQKIKVDNGEVEKELNEQERELLIKALKETTFKKKIKRNLIFPSDDKYFITIVFNPGEHMNKMMVVDIFGSEYFYIFQVKEDTEYRYVGNFTSSTLLDLLNSIID